ncbi:MAG: hypothetical protein COV48_06425 [Elusimicrobia bacterium CG11_big_fil_rev_8_21_14_0_20_64_6]|nr:MAG: hypothetical protein COV48_06425 [Elusimicrobia bacterium CG11_big_fil_rev_8_21_14_0_20_64_6]
MIPFRLGDIPRPLLWILLLGLSLRLGAALTAKDAPPTEDALEYSTIARNIAARGEFSFEPGKPTAMRPPLYPAFLAVFAKLCPGTWSCARLAQALLDTSTIVLIYLFGLGAFGRTREAVAGALLYAVHPVFIAYTTLIVTEPLFLWLWLLGLCLLVKVVKPGSSLLLAAGTGLVMGLAVLCRPAFMFFPPGACVMLLAMGRDRARLLPRLVLVVVMCYLATVPWTIRNRVAMGAWGPVATGGGAALWSGAQSMTTAEVQYQITQIQPAIMSQHGEFEGDAEFFRLAKADYRRNATVILKRLPRRLARYWLTSHSALFGLSEPVAVYRAQGRWGAIAARGILWTFQLAILSLGVFALWRIRSAWTPEGTLAVAAMGYYSLHILTGYWTNRYHLPALAVIAVFAAVAAVYLAERAGLPSSSKT